MLTLAEAFSGMKPIKALVIGDFLLDVYTKGVVNRISPEAPIPVLHVSEVVRLPGGAGNVTLNLQALGASVSVIGRLGKDEAGDVLKRLLEKEGVYTDGLFIEEGFTTPVKNRFLADGQQLIRADYETVAPVIPSVELEVEAYIKRALSGYDVVCISDYGKGFLSKKILSAILLEGKKQNIKVIVDPKGKDFSKYRGAYLIKPNSKEAYTAAGFEPHVAIEEVAKQIFMQVDVDHLLITRSDKGMTLFSKASEESSHFPVVEKGVVDVTGAGDTALAMIAFGLANGVSFAHTITLANIASGISVESVGCKAVSLYEIAIKLLENNKLYKIFWEGASLFPLEKAIESCPVVTLDCNGYQELSNELYQLIKKSADTKKEGKLIACIAPTEQNKYFIELLASMNEIDFVYAKKKALSFDNNQVVL